MTQTKVTVHFVNGSTEERLFDRFVEARDFARHGISYSGNRVALVTFDLEPVWRDTWDAVSKVAGLWGYRE